MNCFEQFFTHIAYLIGLRFRTSIYKNRSQQTESSDSYHVNNEQRENEEVHKFTYDLRTEERKGLLKGESSDDDWSSEHTKQRSKQDRLKYTIEIKGENSKQRTKGDASNHAVEISSDDKGDLVEVSLDDDLVSNVNASNRDTDSLIVEIDVEETSKKSIPEDILVYVGDGEGPLEHGKQGNHIEITSNCSYQVETAEVEVSNNNVVEVDTTHEFVVGDIPSYQLELEATPIALDHRHQENDKVTDEDHHEESSVGNVLDYQITADPLLLNFGKEVESGLVETPEVEISKHVLLDVHDTHEHIVEDIPSNLLEVEAAPVALDHESQEDDNVSDELILGEDHEESSVGNVSEYQITTDSLTLNFQGEVESGEAKIPEVEISKNVLLDVHDTHEHIVEDIPSYHLEVEAAPVTLDHESQEDDNVSDELILGEDHEESSVGNVSEYQITTDPLTLNFQGEVESGEAKIPEVEISKHVLLDVHDTHEHIVEDIPSYNLEVEAAPVSLDHESLEDDNVSDELILGVDHKESSAGNVLEYQITADPLTLNFQEKVESGLADTVFETEKLGDHKIEDISGKVENADEQPIGNLRVDFSGCDEEKHIVDAHLEVEQKTYDAEYFSEEHDSKVNKVLPEADIEIGNVRVGSSTEFTYEAHVEIQDVEDEGIIRTGDDFSKEVTTTKCLDFSGDNIMGEDDKVASTEEITFDAHLEMEQEIQEISVEKLDEDVCADQQDVSGNDVSAEDGNLLSYQHTFDTHLEIQSHVQDEEKTTNEDIFQTELPNSDLSTNLLNFSGNILMTENATEATSEEYTYEAHLGMQNSNGNTIDDVKTDDHMFNEGTHMKSQSLMADNDNKSGSEEDTLGLHIEVEDSNNNNTSFNHLITGDVSFGFDTAMVGEIKSCDENAREYEKEVKTEDSHLEEDSNDDLEDESEKETHDIASLQSMPGDQTITLLEKEGCQEVDICDENEKIFNLTSGIEVKYHSEIEMDESKKSAQIVDLFVDEEEKDNEIETSEAVSAYSLKIEGDTNVFEKESITRFDNCTEKDNKEGYVCDEGFEEEKDWRETGEDESEQLSLIDTSIDIQLSSSHNVEF